MRTHPLNRSTHVCFVILSYFIIMFMHEEINKCEQLNEIEQGWDLIGPAADMGRGCRYRES